MAFQPPIKIATGKGGVVVGVIVGLVVGLGGTSLLLHMLPNGICRLIGVILLLPVAIALIYYGIKMPISADSKGGAKARATCKTSLWRRGCASIAGGLQALGYRVYRVLEKIKRCGRDKNQNQ